RPGSTRLVSTLLTLKAANPLQDRRLTAQRSINFGLDKPDHPSPTGTLVTSPRHFSHHTPSRSTDSGLVHASLRSIGWVCGGAVAVVQALLDVVGPTGTIVVPAFTTDNRDPSRWRHRPVLEEWWPTIRAQLPAFDPAVTPCRELGS